MASVESALMHKINAYQGTLPAAEKRIATYVLEHPGDIIYMSITELANASQASDATVVRFCRRLGMQGYQDLKVQLAQDLVSPMERIQVDLTDSDTDAEILEKTFATTIHTMEYTLRILDRNQFGKAIKAILDARLITIFGCGNSAAVAMDLQHKLMRLDLCVIAFSDAHMQCIEATQMQQGDVCIAISHSGSSKDIVDAAKIAKNNGATIICMTAVGNNPLSALSDIHLDTASDETRYHIVALSSRISLYTIIDSLYAALALRCSRGGTLPDSKIIEKALAGKKY